LRKNIPCNREAKHKIIKKVSEDFQSVFKDNTGISKVDGIRISLEDGWILIRESGTEPMIRLTVEGESLKTATNIMKKGIVLVEQSAREVN
jgi:phosphoglucosamine mutase